jgi:uncharacterized coiled-coil protein SlyX
MTETVADTSGFLGSVQTFGPLLGGFGIIIWLGWRLFWKVDRRSQMELSLKDKRIKELENKLSEEGAKHESELTVERTKRYSAEESLAKANAREGSLETQIQELAEQVARQATNIASLREEVRRLREGQHD